MMKAWEYEQARYSYEWDVEDAEDPINPNFRYVLLTISVYTQSIFGVKVSLY